MRKLPKIFIAASWSRQSDAARLRSKLNLAFCSDDEVVQSRWIDVKDGSGLSKATQAMIDLQDMRMATILIQITGDNRDNLSKGGRHSEFGIALGRGIPIYCLGPREDNIYHHLIGIPYYSNADRMIESIMRATGHGSEYECD